MARFKPKVLLVDDDEHILRSLEVYLKMEEFEVLTATRGEEALKKVDEEAPDIVLLDVMMPGMDGFEVLKRLRAAEKTASLPVIMLTAKGQDMDILTGYQLGAASYMTKPFNLTELVDNINLFFQDRLTPKGEEDDDEEDEEDDGAGDETPAAEPAPPEDRPAAVKDAPAPPEPAPAGAGKKGSARRKKKKPAAADTPPGEG